MGEGELDDLDILTSKPARQTDKQKYRNKLTCRCFGLNKCAISIMAWDVSIVSASGSTFKTFLPYTSMVDTKSPIEKYRPPGVQTADMRYHSQTLVGVS